MNLAVNLSAPPDGQAAAAALDPAAGLDRMMGDRAMYLRVLARFRADYTDSAARLRAALAAGDGAQAHRLAHTLKGAGAMIEARGLCALAAQAEQLLLAGAPAGTKLLDRLEAELGRVLADVELLLAPAVEHPAAGEAVLLEGDLAYLRSLLDLGDSGARDFTTRKRAGLRARLGTARMTELESAVAAFDYEVAVRLLDAADECAADPGQCR
jgi:HPt (histidine-containing phosphotransfer) domain-containing protein